MKQTDKIIDKIRNLLELAEGGNNDEESQTALLMAQKLMLKHKISQQEVSEAHPNEIVLKSLSFYKRIYWWEKLLVRVVADNFRVMFYLQSNKLPHQTSVQRKIVLMGYAEDIELAYEVFHSAAKAMKYYASHHLATETLSASTAEQNGLRRSYYQGFIDGLDHKFQLQREQMQQEDAQYALVIQVPQEVRQAFEQQVNGKIRFKQPASNKTVAAYQEGYQKGTKLNLNQQYLSDKEQ
ncbi:MAG: DUF2786 domain-containing protein [Aerococcaceae bacterium]|nr:DUF2786 domain-containing protein [Aerococcaceae bacterium]